MNFYSEYIVITELWTLNYCELWTIVNFYLYYCFVCLYCAGLPVKFTIFGLTHQFLILVSPITDFKKDIQFTHVHLYDLALALSCCLSSKYFFLVLGHISFKWIRNTILFIHMNLILNATLFECFNSGTGKEYTHYDLCYMLPYLGLFRCFL